MVRSGLKRIVLFGVRVFCVWLIPAAISWGQTPNQGGAGQKPLLAEQVFKNIQLLKGIPVDEFMQTMGFFAAATSMNCTDCHSEESGGDWAKYADDTPLKQRARMMIMMVTALNKTYFGGQRMVTCWTCHQGTTKPRTIPLFSVQYSDMWDAEPDEIVETSGAASVDVILRKYMQALGGPERVANLTSFTGQGTYEGFDTGYEKVPVEIFAKAPNQRATIVHMRDGDSTTTFDGQAGWLAAPERPLPLMQLTGGSLDGAKLEAELSFPARIQQLLTDWRVGSAMVDNKETKVLQGRLIKGGLPIKLYFDPSSDLLVRLVYYSNTPVGVVPIQVDYADYRDVSGVKMPFHWVATWTDGRSTVALSELHANIPIDPLKFAKPAPAVTKTATQ
jgi:photosynthetic reaction center cytochrome c subunit